MPKHEACDPATESEITGSRGGGLYWNASTERPRQEDHELPTLDNITRLCV